MKDILKFSISFLTSQIAFLLILILLGVCLKSLYLNDGTSKIIMQIAKLLSITLGLILLKDSTKYFLKSIIFSSMFSLFLLGIMLTFLGGGIMSITLILNFLITILYTTIFAIIMSLIKR